MNLTSDTCIVVKIHFWHLMLWGVLFTSPICKLCIITNLYRYYKMMEIDIKGKARASYLPGSEWSVGFWFNTTGARHNFIMKDKGNVLSIFHYPQDKQVKGALRNNCLECRMGYVLYVHLPPRLWPKDLFSSFITFS